jgi:hypothetical protein
VIRKADINLIALTVLVLVGCVVSVPGDRVLLAIFVEAALLAVAAPLAHRLLALVALVVACGAAVAVFAGVAAPGSVVPALLAQLPLAAFAAFLGSTRLLFQRPLGKRTAPATTSAVGLGLIASPYWIDGLLALAGSPMARGQILRIAWSLHPPACIARSLFGVDWIREGSLYSRTRFASTDPIIYPSWWTPLVVFAFLGALAFALARATGKPPGKLDGR